ncbi:hypothetical protein BKA62DRAFT_684907 [Auriculariales sp. MPI-PUGE-AT-0066]|nr:hypothetical protein BKA62DRAFT_684907 [Auriculariales sp. MPI-PUGE-AT-0066]
MSPHAHELAPAGSRWPLHNLPTSSPILRSIDHITLQDVLAASAKSDDTSKYSEAAMLIKLDAKFEEIQLTSPFPRTTAPRHPQIGRGLPSTLRRPSTPRKTVISISRDFISNASPSSFDSSPPTSWVNDFATFTTSCQRAVSSPPAASFWRACFKMCMGRRQISQGRGTVRRLSARPYHEISRSFIDDRLQNGSSEGQTSDESPQSVDMKTYRALRRASQRRSTSRKVSASVLRPVTQIASPPRHDELEWRAQYCGSPEPICSSPANHGPLDGLGFSDTIVPSFRHTDSVSLNAFRQRVNDCALGW